MNLFAQDTLIVVRGLPGSGKTTFADSLADLAWHSQLGAASIGPDDYPGYYPEGADKTPENYTYTKEVHAEAHDWVVREIRSHMNARIPLLIVHEVCTTSDVLERLLTAATENEYRAVVMTTENHHGNESVHPVPDEQMLEKERQLRSQMSLLPERLKRYKQGGRPPKLPLATLAIGATVVLEAEGYEAWDGDLEEGHTQKHAKFMAARRAAHKMAKRAGRRISTEALVDHSEGTKDVEITITGNL